MNPADELKPAKLYEELAPWWPLVSAPEDYAEEARFYAHALRESCAVPPVTLLELGSGGGNNASHLKTHFRMTLVDRSAAMLAVSQALNPECDHALGDMRSVRLDGTFDAVFIQDAVMYLTSERDLTAAMETAYVHCRPGGAAVFAPDCVRETFQPSTTHGGSDGESRSIRYLQWTWDPDPADTSYVADFAFLVRDGEQVRCDTERHVLGLFGRGDWLRLLAAVGFQPRVFSFRHSRMPDHDLLVFAGLRPNY